MVGIRDMSGSEDSAKFSVARIRRATMEVKGELEKPSSKRGLGA
jgi:hypothetical protein